MITLSLFEVCFSSRTLGMYTNVNVILPLPRNASIPLENLPVLYLLHGMGDDHSAWLRKTSIERYALRHRLAVVMPDAGQSSYANMAHGGRWRDYLVSELPEQMRSLFPLSAGRDDNYIAGCSMGGAGALKIGLSNPESYSAVGAFSSGLGDYHCSNPRIRALQARAYENPETAEDAQILKNLRSVAEGDLPMRLFFSSGTQDILQEDVERARSQLEALPSRSLITRVSTFPGGHNWDNWDLAIQDFLDFIRPLPEPESDAGRIAGLFV